MRTLVAASVVMGLVFLLAVPASATLMWDGSGDPASAGLELAHGTGITGSAGWYPDHESSASEGGSHVGTMWMNTDAYSGTGTWTRYQLPSATANTELVNASGWTVEMRVQTVANTGDGWGAAIDVEDNVGGVGVLLYPDKIDCYKGDWSSSTSISGLSTGYHTLRIAVAPAGTSANFYIDGAITPNATVNLVADAGRRLVFGDISGGGSGRVNFDYVNVNAPVPEPSAIIMLAIGLLGLVCYAWRKRK